MSFYERGCDSLLANLNLVIMEAVLQIHRPDVGAGHNAFESGTSSLGRSADTCNDLTQRSKSGAASSGMPSNFPVSAPPRLLLTLVKVQRLIFSAPFPRPELVFQANSLPHLQRCHQLLEKISSRVAARLQSFPQLKRSKPFRRERRALAETFDHPKVCLHRSYHQHPNLSQDT